jgi:excisionase family DNA binding protein
MTDSIDWDDDTPRPLDDIVRLAFPDGGVTRDTLLRNVRGGRLKAYRPGKAYLTSLRDVHAMIEATQVIVTRPAPTRSPAVPNVLGLTESDLAGMALDRTLHNIQSKRRLARATQKQPREEERTRTAPERRRAAKARRSKRAKARYLEQKAARTEPRD